MMYTVGVCKLTLASPSWKSESATGVRAVDWPPRVHPQRHDEGNGCLNHAWHCLSTKTQLYEDTMSCTCNNCKPQLPVNIQEPS